MIYAKGEPMLTKQQIDAIKPKEKPFKVSDGDMLYIFTSPKGKKTWKVLYTFEGKKGTVTLGEYPILSIKEARFKRDEIKQMLFNGITPSQKLKEEEKLLWHLLIEMDLRILLVDKMQ